MPARSVIFRLARQHRFPHPAGGLVPESAGFFRVPRPAGQALYGSEPMRRCFRQKTSEISLQAQGFSSVSTMPKPRVEIVALLGGPAAKTAQGLMAVMLPAT